jgi:hypothetical protein
MRLPVILGLSALLLSGCEPYASQIPTSPRPTMVPVASMPEACRQAAANRYAQLPGNIQVEAAFPDTSGGYSVRGQYATVGRVEQIGCRFAVDGTMIGVGRV